jgi:Beta-lactamase
MDAGFSPPESRHIPNGSNSVRNARSQRVVHAVNDLGVGVEGDPNAGVADEFVNMLWVLTCHEEYCSAGVAQVVEPDLGQLRTLQAIGDLYREQIIEPIGLKNTSFPEPSDSSIPEPHAQGYTLQGKSSGSKPIDSTDWSPSEAWTAGEMISTVNALMVYGRALGTGKGLLSLQQSERLD